MVCLGRVNVTKHVQFVTKFVLGQFDRKQECTSDIYVFISVKQMFSITTQLKRQVPGSEMYYNQDFIM